MTGLKRGLTLSLTGAVLATVGIGCNDTTTEVPEQYNQCDLGQPCASTGGSRTCKYNLPNKHFHVDRFPWRGDNISFVAFTFTDWCYARGIITSRHTTVDEDITVDGAAAGFYFTSRYWWSSACTNPATTCLTRREVTVYNGISERKETVCLGTRIYGYPGRNNNTRNITEHGCPGDQPGELASVKISSAAKQRGMAVYRAFPRVHRTAIRQGCAREIEAVAAVLSSRCQRAVRAAYAALTPSKQREVLREAGVR